MLKLQKDWLPGWIGLQLLQLLLQLDLHLHQLIILLHRDEADSKEMCIHVLISSIYFSTAVNY